LFGGITALIVVVIAIAVMQRGGFLREDPVATPTPDATRQLTPSETVVILQQIGTQLVLPASETPVVEVVRNLETLPETELFSYAAVGDILVMYQKAAKMVLYRRETGAIIGSGVITPTVALGFVSPAVTSPTVVATNTPEITPTPVVTAAPQPVRVYWLNASGVVGRTGAVEEALAADIRSQITTDGRSNAKVRVAGTVVIDRSGNRAELAQALATALGGTVGSLPEGEPARDGAEIMIIVAK
jgi:hypothetical protein